MAASIQFSSRAPSLEPEEVRISEIASTFSAAPSIVDRYSFIPLDRDKREIRLLQLLPGASTDPLECKLYLVSRDDGPLYSALSYTWGDHTQLAPIVVNDHEWHVSENLHAALWHLRKKDGPLTLWVDALCIDQKNDVEKSWHVQQMRSTFSEAHKTVVWLGPAAEETDAAMSMLEHIGRVAQNLGQESEIWGDTVSTRVVEGYERFARQSATDIPGASSTLSGGDGLDLLFRDIVTKSPDGLHFLERGTASIFERPWWGRVWVLQELAVGRDIEFVCGHARISQSLLAASAQLYYQYVTSFWANGDGQPESSNYAKRLIDGMNEENDLKQQSLYAQFTTRWAHLNLAGSSGLPLTFILSTTFAYASTRVLQASDPRDYVFGLLGLATDIKHLGLSPDYAKSNSAVYIETARALIKHGHLIALSWCRSIDEHTRTYLPSWVPDLSHKIHRPFQWVVRSSKTNRFVLEPRYNASTGLRPSLLAPEDQLAISILYLQGALVDTVQFCGTSFGDLYLNSMPESKLVIRTCIRYLRSLKLIIADATTSAYATEEQQSDAVWRISVADIVMTPSWEKFRMSKDFPPSFFDLYKRNFPYDEMMDKEELRSHFQMMDAMNIGRRPFLTTSGRLGLGPASVRPGDRIAVFCGAEMPHIVRELEDKHARLVGEVYMHGMMDGEASKNGSTVGVIALK